MALTKISTAMISQDAASVDLNIDAGTLYIDSTNNRVGVGTTSPGQTLDVVGYGKFTSSDGSPRLYLTGSSKSYFFTNTSGGLFGIYDDTNSAYRLVISGSNVGIGTSSPNATLDVNGGTSAGNYFYGGTNNRRQLIIKSFDTVSLDAGHDLNASSINGILSFSTYSTERMRIDSSGNLLIKKTSANNSIVGVELKADGSANPTVDGDTVARFNRLTSDGEIIRFQKDTTTVGSIGNNTDFYIASQDGTGVRFTSTQVLPCSETGATQNTSRSLGSSTAQWANLYMAGTLYGPSTFTIDPATHGDDTGTVVIKGNLQIDGTTTTINSTTVTVDDLLLTLASGAANAAAADGAGIEVEIANATNPSITYDGTNDEWDFNKNINVTGSIAISGTTVIDSSRNLTNIGTISSGAITSSGNITATNQININSASYDNRQIGMDSNGFFIFNSTDSRYDLTINDSGAATFAGAVAISGNSLSVGNSSSGTLILKRPSANYIWADQASGYLVFGTNGLSTSLANASLTLDTSKNASFGGGATFAGNLSASAGSSASTYITFGSNYDTYVDLKATATASAQTRYLNASGTAVWAVGYRDSGAGTDGVFRFRHGTTLDDSNGVVGLEISTGGNVSVGKAGADERLVVNGAIRAISNATNWAASDGALIDYYNGDMRIVAARNGANSSNMTFTTYNAGTASEAMRIDSSGNVGVGSGSALKLFDVNSSTGSATITPTEMVISTRTGASDWAIGSSNEWGILGFYKTDTSGGGAGNIATIGASMQNAVGGYGNLHFKLTNSANSYALEDWMTLQNSGSAANRQVLISADGGLYVENSVGIGTDSPAYPLHISGSGSQRLRIQKTDAGGDADLQFYSPSDSTQWILFGDSTSGNNSGVIKYVHSTNKMHFRTNDVNDRLVISSNGNVGIGTDSPNSPLHIQADGIALRLDGTGNTTRTIFFRSTTDANPATIYSDGSFKLYTEDPNTDIRFSAVRDIEYQSTSTNSTAGHHIFKSYNTEIMKLDGSNNRVGIGVGSSSPAAILHIKGTGDAIRVESTNAGAGGAQLDLLHYTASPADEDTNGSINFGGYYSGSSAAYASAIRSIWTDVGARHGRIEFLTRDDNSFTTTLTVSHDSRVGIGTDSPDNKLHLYHGTKDYTVLKLENYLSTTNGANYDSYQEIKFVANNSDANPAGIRHHANVWQNADSALSFWTNDHGAGNVYLERMRIDGDGNVGIGTNSPGVELDIKRHTNAYPLRVGSEGGQGRTMVFADVASSPTKYNWIAGSQYNHDNGFEITPSTAVGGYTFTSSAAGLVIRHEGQTFITGKPASSGGGAFQVVNTWSSGGVYYPGIRVVNQYANHSYGIALEVRTDTAAGSDRPGILFTTNAAAHSWQIGPGTESGVTDSFRIGYRNSNTPTSFGTWPTNHLVIDTSGNVGLPSQTGFLARGNTSQWLTTQSGAWQTIKNGISNGANGVIGVNLTETTSGVWNGYDNGSCFNLSNGRFTAPITGKYLLTGSAYCNKNTGSSSGYMHFNLWINGTNMTPTYNIGGHQADYNHDFHLVISQQVYLEANDYVEWRLYSNDANMRVYGDYVSLSAMLLA